MRILKDLPLEKEVLLTISKNDLLGFLHTELLSRAHQIKKAGFRAGKVPLDIVFQERGAEAIDSVVRQVVSGAFAEIVGDRILGAPLSYRIAQDVRGLDLDHLPESLEIHTSAIFQPEIPEILWKDIQLNHFVPCPTDQEVEKRLEEMASQTMTSQPLSDKRPAIKGDTLVYTMHYTQRDGSTKETQGAFQLGSHTLPAEFENVLEGISEGHVFNQSLRVPKDFPDKALAGKKVHFKITFHEIRATVPHQPNEEFAQSQGFENLQALRNHVRQSLAESGEVVSDVLMMHELKKKLGHVSSFHVPESWEKSALEALKDSHLRARAESDSAKALDDTTLDELKSKAHHLVLANCIIQKVVHQQQFSVQDEEILNYARVMARAEGKSLDDVVGFLRRNNSLVERIVNEIKEHKALKWISTECSKERKDLSLEDLNHLAKEAL